MAKGANAKIEVENKIREAFGDRFIGISEKKLYVEANDGNGEMVQICLSLTCPKVGLNKNAPTGEVGMDFSGNGLQPTEFKPAEITQEETENIRKLLAKVGF